MKNLLRLSVLVIVFVIAFAILVSCAPSSDNSKETKGTKTTEGKTTESYVTDTNVTESNVTTASPVLTSAPTPETQAPVDYASELKLNMDSETVKQTVTVKTYVDGDTTHFFVPASVLDTGVLKARYIAINTPESTGKIEEYGKKASNFTKEKLSKATSIIIESDDGSWNHDSTGSRYLVWVWYRTYEQEDYRNLNVEILQEGLAIASSSANNRYGSTCVAAINQAKAQKLNIYSGKKDPDFYYGDAKEVTLKELRANIEDYNGIKVAFEGVITKDYNNGVYIEDYDSDTDTYYGMYVYYGFGLSGEGLDILSVGNRSRIVGTVQYYEAGGTYQVSGLTYRIMKPKDPGNIQKISEGHAPSYVEVSPYDFNNKKVEIVYEKDEQEEKKTIDYSLLTMNTTVSMNDLYVKKVYT
ncbi:MAG: thermonuclease family protein, partial [Clostridia bacterium]|nr:thermonuclease family protein [Clostridia bacterium]